MHIEEGLVSSAVLPVADLPIQVAQVVPCDIAGGGTKNGGATPEW